MNGLYRKCTTSLMHCSLKAQGILYQALKTCANQVEPEGSFTLQELTNWPSVISLVKHGHPTLAGELPVDAFCVMRYFYIKDGAI